MITTKYIGPEELEFTFDFIYRYNMMIDVLRGVLGLYICTRSVESFS